LKTKTQLLRIVNQFIEQPTASTPDNNSENKKKESWFKRLFK